MLVALVRTRVMGADLDSSLLHCSALLDSGQNDRIKAFGVSIFTNNAATVPRTKV